MIKNIVEFLVKHLVESPDKVAVTLHDEDHKLTVTIEVAGDDLKRVIGREGRVVRAIQTFISAYNARQDVDVIVNTAA